MDDPDDRVRASVYCCMAFNQDISAIPLIVALEKNPKRTEQRTRAATHCDITRQRMRCPC